MLPFCTAWPAFAGKDKNLDYKEFINQLQQKLQDCLGEAVHVAFHQVTKNNDICRDCFLISEAGKNISPAIYLEEYYDAYKRGMEIGEIAGQIQKLYRQCLNRVSLDAELFGSFQNVRKKVLCRLINREKNRKLLEKIPFIPYLDLAVVFYFMLEDETFGSGTVMIYQEHLKFWNVDAETLYQTARENTKRLLPGCICNMKELLLEILAEEEVMEYPLSEFPMYVLTNEKRYFGACGMLYDSVLADAAGIIGGSFYVLPSSIHECILVPQSSASDPCELSAMVQDINRTQVLPEEVLSDGIYCYHAEKHQLIQVVTV